MRRLFIGDVQGCREELEDLLELLRFDPAGDRLYFVGDLLQRGPDSLGVLEIVERTGARFVLGNHEAGLLASGWLDEDASPEALDEMAGRVGLEGLARSDQRTLWGQRFREAPLLLDLDDLVMVHAAVPPELWTDEAPDSAWTRWCETRIDALPEGPRAFPLSARYCDAHGARPERDWPPPEAPFLPWTDHYRGRRKVVYGHWARRGLYLEGPFRGLDSGCVYGGHLSAWIAEEDRLVQTPARRPHH